MNDKEKILKCIENRICEFILEGYNIELHEDDSVKKLARKIYKTSLQEGVLL